MQLKHLGLIMGVVGIALVGITIEGTRVKTVHQPSGALRAVQSYIDSTTDERVSKDSARVFAQFDLVNEGASVVKIVKVESACGCATPRIEPAIVQPRGRAIVYTEAKKPAFGEKNVEFLVHTDSLVSPLIKLHLRLTSNRVPPYLSSVRGDLSFYGSLKAGDRAELLVHTISNEERGVDPKIVLPLDCLKVVLKDRNAVLLDGIKKWQNAYRYEIVFDSLPPPGIHTEKVSVEDPWDSKHVVSIPVYIENSSAIRVFPRMATLSLKHSADYSGEAKFIVKNNVDSPVSIVGEEQSSFLSIEKSESGSETGVSMMVVRLKSGSKASVGDYHYRIKAEAGEEADIVILVRMDKHL